MGCCYSYEEEDDFHQRSAYLPTQRSRGYSAPYFAPKPNALYGEYRCSRCGNFWVSRLSWRDRSQQCKRCMADVRPRNQRELRPSDFTRSEDQEGKEHPQHLCEMCKHVGGYCGRFK